MPCLFLPQILGADNGSAGRQGVKGLDHQNIDGIHQGYGGNGIRAYMGYHKGIYHAHKGDQKLFGHQGKQHGGDLTVGKKMGGLGWGLVHGEKDPFRRIRCGAILF